jgi:hypothetical protein
MLKPTPAMGDLPGVLPVPLRFRPKSSSVVLLDFVRQQYVFNSFQNAATSALGPHCRARSLAEGGRDGHFYPSCI